MKTTTILLDNSDKVNRFVTMMSKHRCPIYLTTKRYKVNAKSLMGIFSMDLTKPLTVEIGSPNINKEQEQEEQEQIYHILQDLREFDVTV